MDLIGNLRIRGPGGPPSEARFRQETKITRIHDTFGILQNYV